MRSLQWLPHMMTELGVSSQSDLLSIIMDLSGLQRHSQRCLPLLVDMDPHYRLLKLMYGSTYRELDFRRRMRFTPLLYGVCNRQSFLLIVLLHTLHWLRKK